MCTQRTREIGFKLYNGRHTEKYIGATITADMTVSQQCDIAASKGNQIVGLIRINITYKEKI